MRTAPPGIRCGLTETETETEAEAPEQSHGGQRRVGSAMNVPHAVEPFEGQGERHQQPVNDSLIAQPGVELVPGQPPPDLSRREGLQ